MWSPSDAGRDILSLRLSHIGLFVKYRYCQLIVNIAVCFDLRVKEGIQLT